MKIDFSGSPLPRSGTIVIFASEGGKLAGRAAAVDVATGGHIAKAIKAAKFEAKRDSSLDIVAPGKYDRAVVFGLGNPDALTARDAEMLGGAIAGTLQSLKVKEAAIAAELPGKPKLKPAEAAALIGSGAKLRVYSFDRYKTKKKDKPNGLAALAIHTAEANAARKAHAPFAAIAEGVHLARDLVNEPANRLFPVEFAARARQIARHGL